MNEIFRWMGDARLDRLETSAKSGFASPEQMLKLISEVRRRRIECDTYQARIQKLEDILRTRDASMP